MSRRLFLTTVFSHAYDYAWSYRTEINIGL